MLGPIPGWMSGWTIIVADLVVMPSLAQITGSYMFLLFGADGMASNKYWTMLVGVIFILLMTWICVIGIELNAEHAVRPARRRDHRADHLLGGRALQGLRRQPGQQRRALVELGQSICDQRSLRALSGGLLAALFIYWGWDTAVSVNEETKDSKRTPGLAAVISTLVLVGTYIIVSIAAQAIHGPAFLTNHSDDVLSATGNLVLGSPFDKFLIIAVLTSAAASTQTTILPAARSELSMAVHRALPPWFGQVDRRRLTPANATWLFGIIAVVFYAGLSLLSDNVLSASIDSVGLMIAIYYGLTGIICPIYYRRYIFTSFKRFVLVGLAPFIGGSILWWTFVKSTMDSFQQPETTWFGIESYWVMGMILLAVGIPIMLWWRSRDRAFFERGTDPIDQRPDPEGNGPEPPPIVPGTDTSMLREA